MRALAAMLAVGLSFDAAAQEPTAEPPPPAPAPPRQPLTASIATPAPPAPLSLHVPPGADVVGGWRSARIVSVTGTLLGLAGTAVSAASVIYIAVTNDPNRNTELNPPSPTDPGPVLAYVGSTASAVGFVLSASALGYQHHLLDRLGVDPGRGRFAAGTTIGVVGFTAVGASYLFGLRTSSTRTISRSPSSRRRSAAPPCARSRGCSTCSIRRAT